MLGQCFSSSSSLVAAVVACETEPAGMQPRCRGNGQICGLIAGCLLVCVFLLFAVPISGSPGGPLLLQQAPDTSSSEVSFPNKTLCCWASSGFPLQAASLLPTACPHASFGTFLSLLVVSTVGSGLLEQRLHSRCDGVFDSGCSGLAKCSVAKAKIRIRRFYFPHHFRIL